MMIIREEIEQDIKGISRVHEQAFGRPGEAQAVNAIRSRGLITLSLVAVLDEEPVGHILFSPVQIQPAKEGSDLRLAGLAPLAVLPQFQKMGIGSQLCKVGLGICQERGIDAVFVLGHPDYYPQFGFVQAKKFGFSSQWDVPDDAFMAVELKLGILSGSGGVVYYHQEFEGL